MPRERPSKRAKASAARRARALRLRPFIPLALFVALCTARSAGGQSAEPGSSDPRELLAQLNKLSIDSSSAHFLRDAHISRDRVSIYFNRGFLGLFSPVEGEVTGAIFVGDGEVLLIPPDAVERQSLVRFTGSPVLDEKFSSIFLRFTDNTAKELLALARPPESDAAGQVAELLPAWNDLVRRLSPGQSLRVLEDLVSDRRPEYFTAAIGGMHLGNFDLTVDERRPEAVQVGVLRVKNEVSYADIWSSFKSQDQISGRVTELSPVSVLSYRIETRIEPDQTLEGRAELELEARTSGRFLAFELSRRLEVSDVRDEHGTSLVDFQGPRAEATRPSDRSDRVAVVLPRARAPGESFRLIFAYRGGVITDVGNHVLYVGAHESWYPNLGPRPRALYDLTFEYPERLTLVATGRCVEESSAQGNRRSRWVSDGPLPMAGFNLGPYDSRSRALGKLQVSVYASPEAESALERRYLEAQAEAEAASQAEPGVPAPSVAAPPVIERPAPSALIGKVTDSAAQTVSYFETLFGPFPYPKLAISQIPGDLGQGWPGLVYLPTFAFLPARTLSEPTLRFGPENLEDRVILEHEIAHQWWGNLVGWRTYHDQWLSEGFASYAAALELAQEKDGDKLFRELLRDYRRDLLAKDNQGDTVESAGPIWLGGRLSNSLDPKGFDAIVYKKACWVIQMLHFVLTDPESGSDARFFQMLRDFIATYRGEDPSTEDLIAQAEKYMTRASDLDRDKKLDWFFREWVYSTGIPEYKLQSSTRHLGRGPYQVEGTITQSGVPAEFEMLVPVTVVDVSVSPQRKQTRRLVVPVTSAGGHFRFTSNLRPEHIAIDEDSILAVVR
ncbi:MAG TPA: M1 family aminopeptidase [Terriglobia bacterium]